MQRNQITVYCYKVFWFYLLFPVPFLLCFLQVLISSISFCLLISYFVVVWMLLYKIDELNVVNICTLRTHTHTWHQLWIFNLVTSSLFYAIRIDSCHVRVCLCHFEHFYYIIKQKKKNNKAKRPRLRDFWWIKAENSIEIECFFLSDLRNERNKIRLDSCHIKIYFISLNNQFFSEWFVSQS